MSTAQHPQPYNPETAIRPQQPQSSMPPAMMNERDQAETMAYAEESTLSLADMLDILYRRGWWMLAIFLLTIAVGMLWTLTRKPMYASTTEIMVAQSSSNSSSEDIPLLNDLAGLTRSRSIATQVRILNSPDMINEAFTKLPISLRRNGFADNDPAKGFVKVQNIKDTDVISITVTALKPDAAAAMAKSITATYKDRDLTQNRDATRSASSYIQDELKRVGDELHIARRVLADFKRASGIITVDSTLQTRALYLATIEAEASKADREYQEAQQGLRTIESQLNNAEKEIVVGKNMQENPLIVQIDGRIESLEARRAELLQDFLPTSPEVKTIDNQIREARERRTALTVSRISSESLAISPVRQALQQQYVTAVTSVDTSRIRLQVLGKELAEQKRVIEQLPNKELQLTELMSNVGQLESMFSLLSEKYQTLRISEEARLSNVRVIAEAEVEPAPVSPKIARNASLFIILGIIMAIGLAMLLEAFDDRIHSEEAIEKFSRPPVLAYVPFVADSPRLIDNPEHRHSVLESMRLLRSNLTFASMDEAARTLLVTSAAAGDGKSSTAINLAAALAMDGKRVVMVDADLRRPSLHTYFGLSREIGLTNVATGQIPLEKALQATSIEGVFLLAPGPLPPNPPEVLNAQGTRRVIAQLVEQFDMVVIDSPPVAGLSDVSVLSTMVDGILVVVSASQTQRAQLRIALRSLEQVEAPILGFVLNKMTPNHRHYGSYYYYYYYSYYYYHADGMDDKKRSRRHRRRKDSGETKALTDANQSD